MNQAHSKPAATPTAKPPLISVVVPVYNAQRYLRETCDSILTQTFTNFEILLVDDHSSDDSFSIMQQIASENCRVQALRPPQRCGGPAGPRNFGIAHARGRYIALCDADDLWMKNKLAAQMEVMMSSGARMCSAEAKRFSDKEGINLDDYNIGRQVEWRRVGLLENQLKNKIVTSSVVVERKMLLKYPFKEDARYRVVEDYDAWLRIIEENKFCAKLLHPLVGYRICDSQISANKLKQIKRVFGVHWRYGHTFSRPKAVLFAATHAAGAAVQRALGLSV